MELKFLDLIQQIRSPILDTFFKYFTTIGNHAELWFIIIIVLSLLKKYRRAAKYSLLALLTEVFLVEGILKHLFQRTRPFYHNTLVQLIIEVPSGYSFPSGHTASSFAIAMFLYLNDVPFKKLILGLAYLMGFSRLYVYVHYPSDVIVGALIGIGVAYFVKYVMDNQAYKFKLQKKK